MKYLSVCSGIEAATCAWHPLGWEPVGFSEIDPFPRSVLKHHYPNVPLFGDFTEIQADDIEPIDLLVGGTPCQSFSVAGLRGGMADDRGNLALEFCRLALRTRPRWIVWENVPGVLSSNEGRDFGSFLGALAQCGYGFAYRVLDAQFVRVQSHPFAVPQRRRRVFVVGYLGDWRRAAQVLFERESMCGHPPPSREAGKGTAGFTKKSFGDYSEGVGTLRAAGGDIGPGSETLTVGAATTLHGDDIARTLSARHDSSPCHDRGQNVVAFKPHQSAKARTLGASNEVTPTLSSASSGNAVPCLAFSSKDSGGDAGEVSPTLRSMNNSESHANGGGQVAIATSITLASDPIHSQELAQPITNRNGDPGTFQQGQIVRRLTPTECERLQGFEPGWTNVPYRGKPACDGPRYKAIGNSMAVNVMSFLGQRIQAVAGNLPNGGVK